MTEREKILREMRNNYECLAGDDYSRTSASILVAAEALIGVALDIRDALAGIEHNTRPSRPR